MTQETNEGQTSPMGASLCAGGANFSVYSKRAKGIELLLFDGVDGARPKRVISIVHLTSSLILARGRNTNDKIG